MVFLRGGWFVLFLGFLLNGLLREYLLFAPGFLSNPFLSKTLWRLRHRWCHWPFCWLRFIRCCRCVVVRCCFSLVTPQLKTLAHAAQAFVGWTVGHTNHHYHFQWVLTWTMFTLATNWMMLQCFASSVSCISFRLLQPVSMQVYVQGSIGPIGLVQSWQRGKASQGEPQFGNTRKVEPSAKKLSINPFFLEKKSFTQMFHWTIPTSHTKRCYLHQTGGISSLQLSFCIRPIPKKLPKPLHFWQLRTCLDYCGQWQLSLGLLLFGRWLEWRFSGFPTREI